MGEHGTDGRASQAPLPPMRGSLMLRRVLANVGNRSPDFVGKNYERAFKLPNYGNRLG